MVYSLQYDSTTYSILEGTPASTTGTHSHMALPTIQIDVSSSFSRFDSTKEYIYAHASDFLVNPFPSLAARFAIRFFFGIAFNDGHA